MTTLFVKALTVIDASYLHPQRGLLGESWIVDIELDGSLDHQGMVLDFSHVKKLVKRIIDERFDHKLLVPERHCGLQIERQEHRCDIRFTTATGEHISHSSPTSAVTLVATTAIDGEALAQAIVEEVSPALPDNVDAIRLNLRTESIDGPGYQYSHGLKHHEGNCQRIAHGHRSRIEIERNGERSEQLEREWAQRWRDIYIGTSTDLLEQGEQAGTGYCRFGYTSNQGMFQLELPAERVYLIDSDSTVENLAQHIADSLKRQEPEASFRVFAYEGVNKGALGIA